MNNLLIFFAFPIALVIISAILQKALNNPIAVASLVFAIFLVITFAFFDETFLIAVICYTILSLVTAYIVKLIHENNNEDNDENSCNCRNVNDSINTNTLNSNLYNYGYRFNRNRRY